MREQRATRHREIMAVIEQNGSGLRSLTLWHEGCGPSLRDRSGGIFICGKCFNVFSREEIFPLPNGEENDEK